MQYIAQSPEDGACGLILGMTSPTAESGVLYGPLSWWTKKSAMSGEPKPNPPQPYETDPKAIAMLWRTSEAATGVKFEI